MRTGRWRCRNCVWWALELAVAACEVMETLIDRLLHRGWPENTIFAADGLDGAHRGLQRAGVTCGATRFTAELEFGLGGPAVGRLVDAVLALLLGRRLTALRMHMHEEGENLKRQLERGSIGRPGT
jgi:hypothetical protein